MASRVLSLIKRELVRRYPEYVGAYHHARHKARSRREQRSQMVATTPEGFRFVGSKTMQDGTFEPQETAFIVRRMARADVFVDVGANAGYFTCLARQRGKRAIAVEPAEQNLELLFRNLRANGWTDVEVFPVGLAEHPGLGVLYGDGTGASLVRRWAGMSEAWQRTIPLSTLDVLLSGRFAGDQLLIKVDVEGAEHPVLSGAVQTLAREPAPIWLVEVCFTENFTDGINPRFRDTFDLFWSHGYAATSLDADRPVHPEDVARWLETGRRDFGYVSYVFEKA